MSRTQPDIAGIKAFDKEGLADLLSDLGAPRFRLNQIVQWIYGKHVSSYEEMTNLPKDLRAKLAEKFPLHVAKPIEVFHSKDGSRKYLIEYSDGTRVEAVGIPAGKRLTVCFSTQAGCNMKCAFCATGRGGFARNLAPGEIYDQVAIVANDFERRVTNAVSMGQGEPFLNYNASLGAMRFLNMLDGMNIGARHITVSTCGIIQGIKKLARENEQFTLAVSLHSALQKTRDLIMPGVKSTTIARLHSSLLSYQTSTGRRPSLEYALIKGVNDSDDDLEALIEFCKDLNCHVNLIFLNEVEGNSFKPSSIEIGEFFKRSLENSKTATTIRASKGSDIMGACGQLLQKYK